MRGANVESKTRVTDLDAVARVVARLGAWYEGRLDQVDSYFRVPHGRLKLREVSHLAPDGRISTSCELIRYDRPDEGGARVSRYERADIDDPGSAGNILSPNTACVAACESVATSGSSTRPDSTSTAFRTGRLRGARDGLRRLPRTGRTAGARPVGGRAWPRSTATVEGSYIDLLERRLTTECRCRIGSRRSAS